MPKVALLIQSEYVEDNVATIVGGVRLLHYHKTGRISRILVAVEDATDNFQL